MCFDDQVQPLMFKHKWKVKLLTELNPKKNSGLLGLNVNRSTIKIRLRTSGENYYPYSHHMGTMLHELAHMKYGNHSAEFYDLWNELKADMEKILSGRMTIPFALAGCGIKLGGGTRARNEREIREARLQRIGNLQRFKTLGLTGSYRLGSGDSDAPSSSSSSSSLASKGSKKRHHLRKRNTTPPSKRRKKFLNAVLRRTKNKKDEDEDEVIDLTDDAVVV